MVRVVSGISAASPAGTASPRGRRARVAARTRLDFWFDAVILVGYTIAYSYGFTGVVIHEWLGIGLGIALLLHLTLHWDWVVRTTRRLVSPRGSTPATGGCAGPGARGMSIKRRIEAPTLRDHEVAAVPGWKRREELGRVRRQRAGIL